jgi:hypothetical protein
MILQFFFYLACRPQIELPYTVKTLVLHFYGDHLKWCKILETFFVYAPIRST